jgi:hemerythrin-like domain-containing protein
MKTGTNIPRGEDVQPQAPPTHNPIDQGAPIRQPQLGQSHTAEGELDLSAIYVIHHALRRDLRDFDLAVPATPLADTASWTALRRRWTNFTTAFQHHTQVEDVHIWPSITQSLPDTDATARSVLAAMATEHEQIESLFSAVTDGFNRLAAQLDGTMQRQLAEDLRRARQALLTHLAREEREALPLMQRHLAGNQWKAAQRAAAKEYGLSDLRFAVPWSAREIPAGEFPTAFAHGGRLMRVLLGLTRRGFERQHRVAFRHIHQPH